MTAATPDPRIDRLYNLLPAIYRLRDAEQGYPLRALLAVISEQVNVVEDNITQLYENWFVETAEDWAVPYIADLIGYRPVSDAGPVSDDSTAEGRALNRILIPRREVANTIQARRRKGTLALLEQLARDVAGWPAYAREFFKLLGWNQNINHLHMDRARTVDVRLVEALDRLDGPFDPFAHTVDVRRIVSHRSPGRYNIPSVGVFVWRLKSYTVTFCPSYCVESIGPQFYTFSVLGNDAPLFIQPQSAGAPDRELTVPDTIRRMLLDKHMDWFYGKGKSLAIWADGWAGYEGGGPVPATAIVAADLTNWQYMPHHKHIAVDPVLGRIAFPPGQLPKRGVRVSYHYGFSADMGGGEYSRPLSDPGPREVDVPDPKDATKTIRQTVTPSYYRIGKGGDYHRVSEALQKWQTDQPWDAVIELTDSTVYVEPIAITLGAGRTMQIRAANRKRPVLRLLDWQTDLPDSLSVSMDRGSRFTMDGLLVTGRPLRITGPVREGDDNAKPPVCGSAVIIRHCTFVPGWALEENCEPKRPGEPSLELFNVRASVSIEHSITGSIDINEDEVNIDPIPLKITDSIVDGTSPKSEAIRAPGYAVAHTALTIARTTVFGIVDVREVVSAEDSIFCGCLNVARRQVGCMRFCYVPPGCRTPRRYHCQPDLVVQAVKDTTTDPAARAAGIANEQQRVRPQFTDHRYGNPGYAQLGANCPDEIRRGAEDESEMGAFHDLFQPQREANLRQRLEEFTPAGMDAGIVFVT